MSVVSPTSRFTYKSIRLHRGRFAYTTKSFRLHGLSRFAYIKVVSPTLIIFCEDGWKSLPTVNKGFVVDRIFSLIPRWSGWYSFWVWRERPIPILCSLCPVRLLWCMWKGVRVRKEITQQRLYSKQKKCDCSWENTLKRLFVERLKTKG